MDIKTGIDSLETVDYQSLLPVIEQLYCDYSTRSRNAIRALIQECDCDVEKLYRRLSARDFRCERLRNVGRKSIPEVKQWCDNVKGLVQDSLGLDDLDSQVEQIPVSIADIQPVLPANIDTLLPMISPYLSGRSVRVKNAFLEFLREHNNSLLDLYADITDPSFEPGSVKNIGRGSVEEIKRLFDSVKVFLEGFSDEQSVTDALTGFHSKTLDDVQIPTDSQEGIQTLQATLGHFPLFAAISAYFDGLEGDARTIIDGCINMHEGQTLPDRAEVALELNVTPERIRQRRNKLVYSLEDYFASYRSHGFVDKCPYDIQMRHINEEINATEGTNFNLNFINWVLASTFEEVTLLGDVVKAITGYYEKECFLSLVPTGLCQYMDFTAFIEDIEAYLAEKRIDEVKVDLQNLIKCHLKTQYCEDEMPAIETACRSILFLHYPVEVDFGQVIFRPNARKNNPIVLEEIIRAAGHPLTLEEIFDEFVYQYPERYTEMNSLRGSINKNPNIIPIGRTSTYSLVEWEGRGVRGGSIRQIVVGFLREHEPTLATLSEITEHVCKFRPTTDEYSILTNLSLEKSGLFSFFFKEGVRYIGLSENIYPIEFFPYSGDSRNAVTMSICYPKLIAFLEQNDHFPFSNDVNEDELHLHQFWRRQERYFGNGQLESSGLAYHTRILNDFGHLIIGKKEYEWRKKYDLLWQKCFGKERFELDEEKEKELDSFTKSMLHDYNYNMKTMPHWKKEAIEKFMCRLAETANV